MIAHFYDFCLWVYVLVDDKYKELEGQLRLPGPRRTAGTSCCRNIFLCLPEWLEHRLPCGSLCHRIGGAAATHLGCRRTDTECELPKKK